LRTEKLDTIKKESITCSVILSTFENGWDFDKWNYEDLMPSYCEDVLYIPEEKISEFLYVEEGIEIILENLDIDDVTDDWYINLRKISNDICTI